MTEKDIQNQKNIEMHEANGVEIPYHQSVIIEDGVTIGKGTVIMPNTMLYSGEFAADVEAEVTIQSLPLSPRAQPVSLPLAAVSKLRIPTPFPQNAC